MEDYIREIMETCKQVLEIMSGLNEHSFMTIMCQLFDEYHRAHNDFDPVQNSQFVVDMVKEVNSMLGEYK